MQGWKGGACVCAMGAYVRWEATCVKGWVISSGSMRLALLPCARLRACACA